MSFSKISLWFSCILISVISFFYYPKWNKDGSEATISWDVSGYYWYLPAFLIYRDIKKIEFTPGILEKYKPTHELLQAFKHDNGNYIFKYSAGQSILMLPGFTAGHLAAKVFGYPEDGFSRPYQFGIFLWGLLVTLIGLILIRKILLKYFSETAVGLTILTIAFATNFLEYGAITNSMTHNYLFALYASLLLTTINFYETPSFKHAIGIGVITGLMALTRPSEMIAIFIPLAYGVSWNYDQLKSRIHILSSNYKKLLVAIICFTAVGSIQLFYWKAVSGDWLVYSYEEQGFSWLRPHIYDCLFSGRAGWLVYTPVMVLSLIGFYPLLQNFKSTGITILIFSLLFFYITFAWDIWWYGGSVSQRALVQLYPILAFPLTAFYHQFRKVDLKSMIIAGFGLFCVNYNHWMTHQCHYGGMFMAGDMTSEYLKEIFLKNELPTEAKKLLDTRKIFKKNIIDPFPLINYGDSTNQIENLCLSDTAQYSNSKRVKLPFNVGWLRAAADFYTDQKEWDQWKMTQLVLKYYKNGQEVRSDVLRAQRHLNQGQKTYLWLDSKLRNEPDEVELYFWNANSNTKICIENINLIYHKG
jgi:hypothetical protein